MHNICHCGKICTTTSGTQWKIIEYDEKGEVIYAKCIHGTVIVDKRGKTNEL